MTYLSLCLCECNLSLSLSLSLSLTLSLSLFLSTAPPPTFSLALPIFLSLSLASEYRTWSSEKGDFWLQTVDYLSQFITDEGGLIQIQDHLLGDRSPLVDKSEIARVARTLLLAKLLDEKLRPKFPMNHWESVLRSSLRSLHRLDLLTRFQELVEVTFFAVESVRQIELIERFSKSNFGWIRRFRTMTGLEIEN